jgi:hypothetical protein
VIERLVSVDFRDVEFLRAQVPAIRVRRMCSCGCGTLYFAVDPEAKRAPSETWRDNSHVLVEVTGGRGSCSSRTTGGSAPRNMSPMAQTRKTWMRHPFSRIFKSKTTGSPTRPTNQA